MFEFSIHFFFNEIIYLCLFALDMITLQFIQLLWLSVIERKVEERQNYFWYIFYFLLDFHFFQYLWIRFTFPSSVARVKSTGWIEKQEDSWRSKLQLINSTKTIIQLVLILSNPQSTHPSQIVTQRLVNRPIGHWEEFQVQVLIWTQPYSSGQYHYSLATTIWRTIPFCEHHLHLCI